MRMDVWAEHCDLPNDRWGEWRHCVWSRSSVSVELDLRPREPGIATGREIVRSEIRHFDVPEGILGYSIGSR